MLKFAELRNRFYLAIPMIAFMVGLFPQDAANPWMIAPFVITAIYILISGRLAEINLRDPILLCLLLLWFGWIWGSIFSSVPFASEVTLLVLGLLPLTYLVALNRDTKFLLYGFIAADTILALMAIAQIAFVPNAPWRAQLFFDDANTLGAMIAIAVPLTLSFFFAHPDRNTKIAIYTCLVILLGGLIATQSRSGFIGCLIGIAPVLLKNRDRISLRSLKLAAPAAILVIGGLVLTTFGARLVWAMGHDKDVLGRLSLWTSALQMAFINPLHGVGLGTFHIHYPPYKLANDNSAGDWVHMDPLQWAVETGWGTALAFYALAAVVAKRYLKKDLSQLQIGAGASLLTLFAIDHTSYIMHVAPVLILTGVLLSQFSAPYIQAPRYRFALTFSLMAVVVCGLWSVTRTGPTLYFFTSAINGLRNGQAQVFTGNIQRCLDYGDIRFPGCNIEAARLLIQTSSAPPVETLGWLRDAEIANPLSPEPNALRAAYHLKLDPKNTTLPVEELKRALALDPSYWPARNMLVQIYASQGNYRLALYTLEVARNYWLAGNAYNDYNRAYEFLQKKLHP